MGVIFHRFGRLIPRFLEVEQPMDEDTRTQLYQAILPH
jgi:hypothetical protein